MWTQKPAFDLDVIQAPPSPCESRFVLCMNQTDDDQTKGISMIHVLDGQPATRPMTVTRGEFLFNKC